MLGTEAFAAAASAAGGMPPKIQVQFPKPRAVAFPAAGLVGREAKQCTDIATIAMERDETKKTQVKSQANTVGTASVVVVFKTQETAHLFTLGLSQLRAK